MIRYRSHRPGAAGGCRLTFLALLALACQPLFSQAQAIEIPPNDFRVSFEGGTGNPAADADFSNLAYNSDLDEYLVLWRGSVQKTIVGQLLTSSGTPIGGAFEIGSDPTQVARPAGAYDPINQRYLVVWWSQGSEGIYGRLFNTTGGSVGPFPLTAPCSSNIQCNPVVVFNSLAQEYLLVWAHSGGSVREIRGRRIDPDGVVLGVTPLLLGDTGGINTWGHSVAFNPDRNEYLLAWGRDGATTGVEIVGQRLDSGGVPIGAASFQISDVGGLDPDFQALVPDVVYNPLDQEYLVVWMGDDDVGGQVLGELEIFGQRLDADGFSVGVDDFRISRMGGLGNPSFGANLPQVAFNPDRERYLVAWSGDDNHGGHVDDEHEIFVRYLDREGEPIGPPGLAISDLGGVGDPDYDAQIPSIGYSPATGEFLVLWEGDDDENGVVDDEIEVFGQRLTGTDPAIFRDTFESGGTGNWSLTVP